MTLNHSLSAPDRSGPPRRPQSRPRPSGELLGVFMAQQRHKPENWACRTSPPAERPGVIPPEAGRVEGHGPKRVADDIMQ